jgi:hypothetical protein
VFTFTPDYPYYLNAKEIVRGGTGYDIHSKLLKWYDNELPDYDCPLYSIPRNYSYGFLTRGCPNKCGWCIVPQKEGGIQAYSDIDTITEGGRRNHAILMDNNILASDYGLSQIEKIIDRKIHVDFNQALDARLVTDDIGAMLARVKWIKRIRFGCDTPKQVEECCRAITFLRKHGYNGEIFLYCILMDDIKESIHRVTYWKQFPKVYPFSQPRLKLSGKTVVPQWQKDLSRWCNRKELYKSCDLLDYMPRKGFKFWEYLGKETNK